MRRASLALLAGALAAGLVGCAAEPAGQSTGSGGDSAFEEQNAELIEAAKAEGSMVWYGGTSPNAADAVVQAFQERFGITVTYSRLASADLAQRFLAEVAAEDVQASFLMTADEVFYEDMGEKGNTRPLEDEDFGELPDEYRGDAYATTLITPLTVPYNTEEIGDLEIEDWEDLLDPSLSNGRIVLADPRASNSWAQMWSIVLHTPELGEDYLEALAAQKPQIAASQAAMQLVSAGEATVAVGGIDSTVATLAAQGAPIDSWMPHDPVYGVANYAAIPVDAPSPNAGTLFLRWLLSEDGASVYAAAEDSASPIGDVPDAVPLPEGVSLAPDLTQVQEDTPTILRLLGIE